MISKKMMNITAAAFNTKPAEPSLKEPLGRYFRPVKSIGAMAIAYDTEVRMIKDPVRSVNALELPTGIAPNPRLMILQRSVAGMGHESPSWTLEKNFGSGVALSRASAHQMRPQVRRVPTRQMSRDRKTIMRRQNAPPLVPVA
jgi:hypothetical protein